MARRLGQRISKMAGLMGCSWYAVVRTYQKWSKKGQPLNRQGHGRSRLFDDGEQRLPCLVRSHKRATEAQIGEKVHAGYHRQVSAHTVHRCLLPMGLCSRRPVRVPMLTPSTAKRTDNGLVSTHRLPGEDALWEDQDALWE